MKNIMPKNIPMPFPGNPMALIENIARTTDKAFKDIFKSEIRGNFLIEIKSKVDAAIRPFLFQLYDFNFNNEKLVTGFGGTFEYEICKMIIGIHHANTVFLTKEEISAKTSDEKYNDELICGKLGATEHSFVKDPNSCVEVCSVCGEKGATVHSFVDKNGECMEVCSVCGLERKKEHCYVNGVCKICGKEDITKSLRYEHGVWFNPQNEILKYHSFSNEDQTKLINNLKLMEMADFITTSAADNEIVWLSNQMSTKLVGAAELGRHDEVCNALKRIGESSAISMYMNAGLSSKYSMLTAIMLKYATKERNLFADDSV